MSPSQSAAVATLPRLVIAALVDLATRHRLALPHLIDHVLGRRVFATYIDGSLDKARDALTPAQREPVTAPAFAEAWPAVDEPPWFVMTAGSGAPVISDLEATTKLIATHFTGKDLPVRVELRKGTAWLLVRFVGTTDDMHDMLVPPEAIAAIDAGLVYPSGTPVPTPIEAADPHEIPSAWKFKIDTAGEAAYAAALAEGSTDDVARIAGHAAAAAKLDSFIERAAMAATAAPKTAPVDWSSTAISRLAASAPPSTSRST